MKRKTLAILMAMAASTFGAAVLNQPILLLGAAIGVFVLYFQSKVRKKTASITNAAAETVAKLAKVNVYIDEPNIYSGAYGNNLSVDYGSIAPALAQLGYSAEKTFLYVMEKPESFGYQSFLSRVRQTEIEVIERGARKIQDDIVRKDIDTWLATDIALGVSEVDTVVLITGDNDFSYTVKRLQDMQKKVVVVGIKSTTSRELRSQADQWLDIEHLAGVCQRKVRPSKLSKPSISAVKPRYQHPVKPKLKRTLNTSIEIMQDNRNSA